MVSRTNRPRAGWKHMVALACFIGATLVWFTAEGGHEAANPLIAEVVVLPSVELRHGQSVEVVASGFRPNAQLVASICDRRIESSRSAQTCDERGVYAMRADQTGSAAREIEIRRIIRTRAGEWLACGVDVDCVLVVTDMESRNEGGGADLDFREG
jgi:Neocarzinostatin family